MDRAGSQPVKSVSMETVGLPAGIRELPIVGGHLALDFANTVDDPLGPRRYDHLAVYPELLTWSVRVESIPPAAADALARTARDRPRAADAAVRRAAALRDALNATFGALADTADPGPAWPELRPFVTAAHRHAGLSPGPALSWRFTDLESPLWPVAAAAFDLLTSPDVARLKRCAGCPWLFLDRSKNASRRWCSMQDCGTHEKIQRYVSKRADLRTGRRIAGT